MCNNSTGKESLFHWHIGHTFCKEIRLELKCVRMNNKRILITISGWTGSAISEGEGVSGARCFIWWGEGLCFWRVEAEEGCEIFLIGVRKKDFEVFLCFYLISF